MGSMQPRVAQGDSVMLSAVHWSRWFPCRGRSTMANCRAQIAVYHSRLFQTRLCLLPMGSLSGKLSLHPKKTCSQAQEPRQAAASGSVLWVRTENLINCLTSQCRIVDSQSTFFRRLVTGIKWRPFIFFTASQGTKSILKGAAYNGSSSRQYFLGLNCKAISAENCSGSASANCRTLSFAWL